MIKFLRLFFLIGLFFPFLAQAQVVISEIMYDLEGADSDREWIEIFNSGSGLIDLSGWKFFENEINHSLNLIQGQSALIGGGRAVIAASSTKFLIDWPNFSGALFDSSFSLSNTGEGLVIKDDSLNIVDIVFYNSSWGASGNGYSLQKVNNQWIAASSTPGNETPGISEQVNQSFQATSSISSESNQIILFGSIAPLENSSSIKAIAGQDRTVIAGAETEYKGKAFGLKDEPLENARYLWIFGDGTEKEGKTTRHTYFLPGIYQAVLNVSSGYYSASDYLKVTVISNELYISEIKTGTDSWIEIHNPSIRTLDISRWVLKSRDQKFVFPDSTYILPKSFLAVVKSVSAISPAPVFGEAELLYPTGFSADLFSYNGLLEENESFNRIAGQTQTIVALESPGKEAAELRLKQENPPPSSLSNKSSVYLEIRSPSATLSQEKNIVSATAVNQSSNVIETAENTKNNVWFWFLASLGVGFFSAAGFIFIRRDKD